MSPDKIPRSSPVKMNDHNSKTSTEPTLGADLASRVARVLDAARTAYVLWGWLPLSLLRRNNRYPELLFIVPDQMMNEAIKALGKDELHQCRAGDCTEQNADRTRHWPDKLGGQALEIPNRIHPVGSAHFHVNSKLAGSDRPQHLVIHLLPQSETLFWFKDLSKTAHNPEHGKMPDPAKLHRDLTLSSDKTSLPARGADWVDKTDGERIPQGPCGPWREKDGFYPVKLLTPAAFAEALIWLIFRDYPAEEWYEEEGVYKGDWGVYRDAIAVFYLWKEMARELQRGKGGPGVKGLREEFQGAWDQLHARGRDPVMKRDKVSYLRRKLQPQLPEPYKDRPQVAMKCCACKGTGIAPVSSY
ncbi:hypothetical protein BDV19DRAFT_391439 [Aspergillus venezuelensis]